MGPNNNNGSEIDNSILVNKDKKLQYVNKDKIKSSAYEIPVGLAGDM